MTVLLTEIFECRPERWNKVLYYYYQRSLHISFLSLTTVARHDRQSANDDLQREWLHICVVGVTAHWLNAVGHP